MLRTAPHRSRAVRRSVARMERSEMRDRPGFHPGYRFRFRSFSAIAGGLRARGRSTSELGHFRRFGAVGNESGVPPIASSHSTAANDAWAPVAILLTSVCTAHLITAWRIKRSFFTRPESSWPRYRQLPASKTKARNQTRPARKRSADGVPIHISAMSRS